ncbi:MAG: transketolase [Candidatus Ryanbacteria bacterium CG10_big_fil_rev_8_21_14_0_10_43_42]|uniref:Transketolase n=1 Tax=Candidatus Ryanbacteria bacterium CG10_big_fil_rev_8_21_14_0_10_43_42 TaxID=1974864 RepID=A0A2M8KX03_9BACT|nr:MAG: transketolase [Candidatus Ryanbacteria bacterium CG10_big_fil_rev_8_21_14_0_10_43_42]
MPLNTAVQLAPNILDPKKVERIPLRAGFGEGLIQIADENPHVVGLCADLTGSTKMDAFAKKYPERFIQIGVAEQNLATVASGLAKMGKIPYFSSYAMFSPGRNWEQIRTTICYNDVHAILVGSHAGISVGPDGATHQAIEDIAITRVIPNMSVIVPADAHEARKATMAVAGLSGGVYLRLAREKTPIMTMPETAFEIGKAYYIWQSAKEKPDVALIAAGPLLHNALLVAQELEQKGIGVTVVNNHTVKPLDNDTIIEAAKNAGAVVTIEEHQIAGGMGGAVAECLAAHYPVPMEFIGVRDRFGESGEPDELLEHFGMGTHDIIKAVKKVLKRK